MKLTQDKVSGTVTVYPNPVKNNTIHLQFKAVQEGRWQLQLLNAAGQPVYRSTLLLTGGASTHSISPGEILAPGIYRLELQGPGNQKQIQQLLVQ